MKNSFLLFFIKCAVIVYVTAFTNIQDLAIADTAIQDITNRKWEVNLYSDTDNNRSNEFTGYIFTFNALGEMIVRKGGVEVKGNWSEDKITKRVTLNFGNTDRVLEKLNNYWSISDITNTKVSLHNNDQANIKLNITSL